MISLLHEPDYEMLGNVEIHDSEWQHIRKRGFFRFVLKYASASWVGRLGAFLIFDAVTSLHRFQKIDGSTWVLIVYGAYAVIVTIVHSVRAWSRLEYRFNPRRSEI